MSFPLKLPPQDLQAMQCEHCQAAMFISSGLSQNAGA